MIKYTTWREAKKTRNTQFPVGILATDLPQVSVEVRLQVGPVQGAVCGVCNRDIVLCVETMEFVEEMGMPCCPLCRHCFKGADVQRHMQAGGLLVVSGGSDHSKNPEAN